MQVGHKIVHGRHKFKKLAADFSRLQGTEAIPDVRSCRSKFFQQVKQGDGRLEVQAVMSHMDAGENYFPVAFFCVEVSLAHYLFLDKASAATPGIGHNTVRAEIVAPVLNF